MQNYDVDNITDVDGLPLYKSSNISIWLILICIQIKHFTLFQSAITLGYKIINFMTEFTY